MTLSSWQRHPALQKLQRAIRREQRLQLLAAAVLFGLGLALEVVFFSHNAIMSAAGLILVILGIRYGARLAGQQRVADSRLMRLLSDNPRHIVWVYSVDTQLLPFGFQFSRTGTMYFKLADGDELTVSLPADDLRLVSRFLNRLLPHATFGYTRHREQLFRTAPQRLRKPVQDDEEAV